jgi:hypothetical protein
MTPNIPLSVILKSQGCILKEITSFPNNRNNNTYDEMCVQDKICESEA